MSLLDDDERRRLTREATEAQLRLTKLTAEMEIARLKRADARRRKIVIAVRKNRERKRREAEKGSHLLGDQGHLFNRQFLRCPECLKMLHRVELEAKRRKMSVEELLASVAAS